jgi:hypothetical protein
MTVLELPTNGDGKRAAAIEDAKAGMSRADIAAKHGMSDGWAAGIRRAAGVTTRKEVAAEPVPTVAPARATGTATRQTRKRKVPAGMIVSAAAVALVAALISYVHIMCLALGVPPPRWLGYLAPVPLDGLVVVSTYAFVVTKTSTFVARCGILVGFLGTLAMNVAAVWPGLVELQHVLAALAAFVPIAVLAVGHIVLQAANER